MGVTVRISRSALDAIAAQAKAAGEQECCGLLLGSPEQIDTILAAPNVAADSRTRFEIDPAVLLCAHKAARAGGPAVAGCYHSHPSGDPTPSAEDAAQAEPNGALWLICGLSGTITAWRAVPVGHIHDRFDPVEIATDTGP
jgi:proteasome lid subunit RPN8/RPN11